MRCVHSRYRINMEVEEPIANFMELLAIFRNINYAMAQHIYILIYFVMQPASHRTNIRHTTTCNRHSLCEMLSHRSRMHLIFSMASCFAFRNLN